MADQPNGLERLVARIREQVADGGLHRLIQARQEIEAQLEGSGRIDAQLDRLEAYLEGGSVEPESSGDVVMSPEPAVLVLRSASPQLATDIQGRSQQDIRLAIDIYLAILQTLQVLLMLYQSLHRQPPTQIEIREILEQTTRVVRQTISMPAPPMP
ncbi:MAG: hypothetical protein ACM4D3_01250 [Candidatus Sericytochromatia bacterium]